MQIYRKQGKKDIFFALAEVVLHLLNHLKQNQVQIDVCIYGIGILITKLILAVFIKQMRVAPRATVLYNIYYEILISFLLFSWRYFGLW